MEIITLYKGGEMDIICSRTVFKDVGSSLNTYLIGAN
jgi:hypothetical protein